MVESIIIIQDHQFLIIFLHSFNILVTITLYLCAAKSIKILSNTKTLRVPTHKTYTLKWNLWPLTANKGFRRYSCNTHSLISGLSSKQSKIPFQSLKTYISAPLLVTDGFRIQLQSFLFLTTSSTSDRHHSIFYRKLD